MVIGTLQVFPEAAESLGQVNTYSGGIAESREVEVQ